MTVCPTLAQFLATTNGDNVASCFREKRGVAATVVEIIPSKPTDPDAGFGAPHVKLRAIDGSWSGYTTVVPLQPALPVGTIVVMKKTGNDTINLAPRQGSDLAAGPNLGDRVKVRVLHYYPDTGDRSLYVTVLDGDYAGQNGWMFALDGETEDGFSVDGVSYDSATPAPTTDPMKRTYTLTSTLRVFTDMQTCKDAFNAMRDDDAYTRLKDAVNSGQYHDFSKGDALHIISDPDANDLWVIVGDDNGNQGCASRYNLPGY